MPIRSPLIRPCSAKRCRTHVTTMSDWRSRCRPKATRHYRPRETDNESCQADFVNGLLGLKQKRLLRIASFTTERGDTVPVHVGKERAKHPRSIDAFCERQG